MRFGISLFLICISTPSLAIDIKCDLTGKYNLNFKSLLNREVETFAIAKNQYHLTNLPAFGRLKDEKDLLQFLESPRLFSDLSNRHRREFMERLTQSAKVLNQSEYEKISLLVTKKFIASFREVLNTPYLPISLSTRSTTSETRSRLALYLEDRGIGPHFIYDIV